LHCRREKVFEALSLISEAVGPSFVMTLLHKRAAANKNPKVTACMAVVSPLKEMYVLRDYWLRAPT